MITPGPGQEQKQHPFQQYLRTKNTDILDVSLRAKVRLFVVWRIVLNKPIQQAQMIAIQRAILQLTGDIYRGTILVDDLAIHREQGKTQG
jgi:hypothetical protein